MWPRTPATGCGPSASTSASPPHCPDSTWSLARPARPVSPCATPDLAGGGTAQVVAFDDLGRRYKVLDSLSDAQLQELEDAVVGRLSDADRRGHSDLLRTLETYLACGGSVVDAATKLYVHRNTLRKRVARIEEVLAIELGTVGGQVEAYLAVRARDVLATRKG